MNIREEEVTALAEKCYLAEHNAPLNRKQEVEAIAAVLREHCAAGEGCVEVRVAISVDATHGIATHLSGSARIIGARETDEQVLAHVNEDNDTHRCIAVIQVPPVAKTPVVGGEVVG